jgi:probable rRNA maturation factor
MMPAPAELTIDVAIECAKWQELEQEGVQDFSAPDGLVARALRQTLVATKIQLRAGAEISILLCDDAFIADLNKRWRGKDAPTNVLSFPAGGDLAHAPMLGDIIIAFETTAREAAEEGKSLRNHFTHLVVHGFLHILGYDHEVDAEAEAMEALERAILAALGIEDPYRGSRVESAETL